MQNQQMTTGKSRRGFWSALIVMVILIPLTVGISWYMGDRRYYIASVLIMIYSMLPFLPALKAADRAQGNW